MIAGLFKNASYFAKFIIALFTILIGFVFFMILSTIIGVLLFNVDLNNLIKAFDPTNPENLNYVRITQSLYSILCYGLPPLFAAKLLTEHSNDYLRFNKSPNLLNIILAAAIIILSMPLINFLIELNESITFPESMAGFEDLMKNLENEGEKATKAFLTVNSASGFVTNLLILAIIPALSEEILFRGLFQRLFHDWWKNIHVAIWVSAFFFSLMHLQFYGLLPRMVLGALLGYLFYWSGSIWLPIIAHFLNNAIAVTIFYLNGEVVENVENIGTGGSGEMQVFFSILIVALLLFSFYRISKDKKTLNNSLNEQDS